MCTGSLGIPIALSVGMARDENPIPAAALFSYEQRYSSTNDRERKKQYTINTKILIDMQIIKRSLVCMAYKINCK